MHSSVCRHDRTSFILTLVGVGVIFGGDALIAQGNARLAAAYQQGKLTTAQYNALYALEVQTQTDVTNLGTAIMNNQPVTQAQYDAALAGFLVPLAQLVPTTLPAPVTTVPAGK
jgi:hypothetical protein